MRDLFVESGFADVEVESFETTLIEIDNAEACWTMFERTMGPLIRMLRAMSPEQRERMRVDGVETLRAEFPAGPVRLTGEVLLAVGIARG
ncbi:hypothetical protein [Saccharopolyspora sp. CA-218241]|uniref:hypothetical protein n=1 Tax=Saccharopolyspora sp. CA-218241 TaxID=3240027 RepID=UPI003D994450